MLPLEGKRGRLRPPLLFGRVEMFTIGVATGLSPEQVYWRVKKLREKGVLLGRGGREG